MPVRAHVPRDVLQWSFRAEHELVRLQQFVRVVDVASLARCPCKTHWGSTVFLSLHLCKKTCNAKVLKEGRGAGGQAQEQGRNGKAAVPDAKPRGLEGDWRAAKEKSAADPDRLSLDGAHQTLILPVEGCVAWCVGS